MNGSARTLIVRPQELGGLRIHSVNPRHSDGRKTSRHNYLFPGKDRGSITGVVSRFSPTIYSQVVGEKFPLHESKFPLNRLNSLSLSVTASGHRYTRNNTLQLPREFRREERAEPFCPASSSSSNCYRIRFPEEQNETHQRK